MVMVDYYIENKSRLKEQPKRTISDYVEQQGILVPRRFNSPIEAKNSGIPILCRSEHLQEYDGVSGLLRSIPLTEFPDLSEKELWQFLLDQRRIGFYSSKNYCSLMGLDLEQFLGGISYSYWENLGGVNRTVIADSSIKGRYHIMSSAEELFNYVIIRDDQLNFNGGIEDPNFSLGELQKLVAAYEKVRNLDHFEPQHCPTMEFQSVDGKNYFLQYHRTRDFKERSFRLERPLEEGEVQASLVRGATIPEGFKVKTTTHYAALPRGSWHWSIPELEEGSFDVHANNVFTEIMSRQRKLQILITGSLDIESGSIAAGHTRRSKFFKPEVSLIVQELNLQKLISMEEWEDLSNHTKQSGQNQHITLQVISDGEKAYLKRMRG